MRRPLDPPLTASTRAPLRALGAVWLGAVLLLLLVASPLGAGEAVGESLRERVAAWIADLRAEDYATREAARKALESQGHVAPDLLEAHRDDPDPEVRRTIRLLLGRMGRTPTAEAPPARDLRGVGVVRLAGQGTLEALFAALADAHGAHIALPEDLDGSTVLSIQPVEGQPFFEVLRSLGRRAGLVPAGGFDRSGRIEMLRGEAAPRPWAAAGPMQVRVAEVSRTRVLPPDGSRRFVVGLDLEWSPAVQLVSWATPEKVEATDPDGRAFDVGAAMRSRTTHGVSTNATSARVQIHLEPTSEEVQPRLEVLAFELPLRIRHQRRALRFSTDGELPRTLRLDEAMDPHETATERIVLEALERPEAERGPWTVRLTAHLQGTIAQRSLDVRLERSDGTLQPAYAGSRFPSADGRLELTARAYGMGDEAPVAVRVRWFAAEERGTLSFRLTEVELR